MPITLRNGVCCNNVAAEMAFQSVEHNIRGLSGLVQAERRVSIINTRCWQAWHCSLKVPTGIFLLVLNVCYPLECLFCCWEHAAAYYDVRHGIQHTLTRLRMRLLVAISRDRINLTKTELLHQVPVFLTFTVTTAQNQNQLRCPVLRPLDFPAVNPTSPIEPAWNKVVIRSQGRRFPC